MKISSLALVLFFLFSIDEAYAQTITGSFSFGGQTRNFRVHLPPNFSTSTKLPLVLNLHGLGSNGQQQELYTGFNTIADTARLVVVYPDALNGGGGTGATGPEWNAYGLQSTPNDVGFLSALIDTMYARYNIDLSRVYSTGMSNGGYMTYRLGCALSCRIAAIASVTGLMSPNPLLTCNISRPVPVMQIHGTNDATVPYSGVATTISTWVSKDGCPGTPSTSNLPDINTSDNSTVTVDYYGPCNSASEVILYTINNGGHTWPDATINLPGVVTNRDFNASSTIWNFFKKYSITAADLSISGLASSYCSGASAVTLTGSPSGGTFSGTGVSGSTFNPALVNPETTVTITYTRTSGSCTYYITQNVTVTSGATASISPASVTICSGSTTLTASGGTGYAWNTGANTASITVSPVTTTSYTVTVSDASGCSATTSRTVTVTSGLTATISPITAIICDGQNITLTASGGTNYSWSNGAATASITVNSTSTTTYTVTATDAGGSCSATASKIVTVNSNLNIVISPGNATICNGENIQLTASGGVNYFWSNSMVAASISVNPSSTTAYIVTVTDGNGCTASASKTVTVNSIPVATISPATATICSGSVTLTASGGTTYSWSNGSINSSITESAVSTTSYTVTVTNANGCTVAASRTVTVTSGLTAEITPNSATICTGENSTLTASGGTNYIWSNGATTESISVNPSSTSTYSVTVSDAGGSCSATTSATVTENPLPVATAVANPVSIIQGDSATLTASGGTSYQWSSGQTTASISESPLLTSTYIVTVTDANGCTATAQATLTVLPSGIKESTSLLSFAVYPNPAQDVLNIESVLTNSAAAEIEIYSHAGKKMYATKTGLGNLQISLREAGFTPGVYFLRLKNENGFVVKKIVKTE